MIPSEESIEKALIIPKVGVPFVYKDVKLVAEGRGNDPKCTTQCYFNKNKHCTIPPLTYACTKYRRRKVDNQFVIFREV